MPPIHIRPATEQDLPAISAIYNDAVLTTTATYDYATEGLERRQAWFRDHVELGLPMFVGEDPIAGIIGWSSLSPYHRRPGFRFTVENSIYVHAEHRGRGLGGRLLEPLIREAARLRLHSIIAAIDASNEASLRLHQRWGFAEVGRFREVGFKFDRWLDVAYLQLLIPPETASGQKAGG
ncbi:MAG TPA: GNAT family N-acetyltransferase [Verrucomicrobiales bacterium]|nr:GNAT family N-acetyltransferase [Verrucomicrobiales bacterium]